MGQSAFPDRGHLLSGPSGKADSLRPDLASGHEGMALVRHLVPAHHGRKRTGATPGRRGRRPDIAGGADSPPRGRDTGGSAGRIPRQLSGALDGPPQRSAVAATRGAPRTGEGQRRQQRRQPRAGRRPGPGTRPTDPGPPGVLPARGAGRRTLRRGPGLLRPRQRRRPHRAAQPSAGQPRAAPPAPQHRPVRSRPLRLRPGVLGPPLRQLHLVPRPRTHRRRPPRPRVLPRHRRDPRRAPAPWRRRTAPDGCPE